MTSAYLTFIWQGTGQLFLVITQYKPQEYIQQRPG